MNIYKVGKFGKISIKNNKVKSGWLYEIVDFANHKTLGYIVKLNAETLKAENSTDKNMWDVFIPIIKNNIVGNIDITHISRETSNNNIDPGFGYSTEINLGALKGNMFYLGCSKNLEHHIHIDIEGIDNTKISLYHVMNVDAEQEEYVKRYLKTTINIDGFGPFGDFIDIDFLDDVEPISSTSKDSDVLYMSKPSFMTSKKETKNEIKESYIKRFFRLIFNK